MRITGLCANELSRWQDNDYSIEIKAQNLNPDDFRPAVAAFAPPTRDKLPDTGAVKGLFTFDFKGRGTLSKGMDATISGEARQLRIDTAVVGMQAPLATMQGKLFLTQNAIELKDSHLITAGLELKSSGKFFISGSRDKQYSLHVAGRVNNLKKLPSC